MYEKGNVSIREEKKIPRMFHSRSHFVLEYRIYSRISRIFLDQISPKKVRCDLHTNTWSALYDIQNSSRYFLAIDFCTVSFHTIISLIAFHASSVTLLMLSLFFHFLTRLVITYLHKSRCFESLATLIKSWWGCSRGNQGYLKTVIAEMTEMVFNFLLWECNEWIMFKKICPVFHVKNGGATYTRINTVIQNLFFQIQNSKSLTES